MTNNTMRIIPDFVEEGVKAFGFSFVDRSKWDKGEWDREPYDKIIWKDPNTGYDCMLHRNRMGAWCGYVGVSQNHGLFGVKYQDFYNLDSDEYLANFNVHGGITFTDSSRDVDENGKGVGWFYACKHVWWFGFDCVHLGDCGPSEPWEERWDSRYWSQSSVVDEVMSLAKQLVEGTYR